MKQEVTNDLKLIAESVLQIYLEKEKLGEHRQILDTVADILDKCKIYQKAERQRIYYMVHVILFQNYMKDKRIPYVDKPLLINYPYLRREGWVDI